MLRFTRIGLAAGLVLALAGCDDTSSDTGSGSAGNGGTGGNPTGAGAGGSGNQAGNGGQGKAGSGSAGSGGSAGTPSGTSGTGGETAVSGAGGAGGSPDQPDPGVQSICGKNEPPCGPITADDCDMTVQFLAHADGDKNAPYVIPSDLNTHITFDFVPPWTGAAQTLYMLPKIDNAQLTHHYQLFSTTQPVTDGSSSFIGGHSGPLVTGWAPGSESGYMPPGIGMEVMSADSVGLQLDLHYNNPQGLSGKTDRSGVELCIVQGDKMRAITASIDWLGSFNIQLNGGKQDVVGECTVPATATILTASPHMHKLGTHMTTLWTPVGGAARAIVDKDYNFNNQVGYDMDPPVVLHKGDTLTTTCSYNNDTGSPVRFGPDTEDEMCFDFIVAYPAHALGMCLGGFGRNN